MMNPGTRSSLCIVGLWLIAANAFADSTINQSNKYAYGANVGWLNAQADTTNGLWIGQYFCTGFVYGANIGWIHFGDVPTNYYSYVNASKDDYGVNVVSGRYLRGFAYAPNIGWINFEPQGDPQIDLLNGNFSGFVWAANVGWISLSNAEAHVQIDMLGAGPDSDADGLPDYWEYKHAGGLGPLLGGTNDTDGDGISDAAEYEAGTDPADASTWLRVTSITPSNSPGLTLTWSGTTPTRLYSVSQADSLSNGTVFVDSGLGTFPPDAGDTTSRGLPELVGTDRRYYRVMPHVPLPAP